MLSGGKPTISPASHDNARGAAIAVKPGFEYRAVRAGSGLPDDDSMAASGQNRKLPISNRASAQRRERTRASSAGRTQPSLWLNGDGVSVPDARLAAPERLQAGRK